MRQESLGDALILTRFLTGCSRRSHLFFPTVSTVSLPPEWKPLKRVLRCDDGLPSHPVETGCE